MGKRNKDGLPKRKPATKDEKLAAALIIILKLTRAESKEMTTKQINDLVEWDHMPVPFAIARDIGWTPAQYNHPSNLVPVLKAEHRTKTNKQDIPAIAKTDRISPAHKEFQSRVLATKTGQGEATSKPASKLKSGTKIRSRGFEKGQRKLPKGRKLSSRKRDA